MIVTYETDKDLLRQAVPEPLEPNPRAACSTSDSHAGQFRFR